MANSDVLDRLWQEAPATIDERWIDWWIANGWSPEITWRAIEGAPDDVGLIHGPERLRRYHTELMELFEDLQVEVRDLRDVGERVVARALLSARARSTGMPVEIDFAVVYEMDSTGRVVAGREYRTEAEALRAAEKHESAIQP